MAEMIVEAFLGSFADVVLERLASSNFMDYFRRVKLETLVDKLESILISINQVLDDAEKKQYENPDVKKWLGDVKHAMYEADQLLDEIATDAPLKKLKAESQPSTSNIFNFIPTLTNPFESRIKELIKSLDSLAQQIDLLVLNKGTCARNVVGVSLKPSERPQTTSLVNESQIYGRDGYKKDIIKYLLEDNDNDNLVSVTSIVGLGGMGKTTLAQLVYNDPKIQERFELRAWVYVSQHFDVIGLTKSILSKFHAPAISDDLDLLQRELHKILTGKKYLLVVDDVWHKKEEDWEQLLLPFNHGSSGSKIIVTTRDKELVYVLKSTKLIDLQQLDESGCWSLFVTHAFHGKSVYEHPNLESIGRRIVKKCGGLPLAVKTLGQLLRKKFCQVEWIKILETDMWRLSDGDSNINSVLRLSYHNLPSNLKRCFAYCSIFPKGYEFEKDELIKLWMAERLLKCCGSDKSEQEFGNEIFCDLESISFFQKPYKYSNHYAMHDLVNDLAKSVSGGFCMQIEGARVEDILERTRHIWCSLQLNCVDKSLGPICELKGLRSLILQGCRDMSISKNVQRALFSGLQFLRMLKFRHCGLSELVDEISNLKLLCYLDLSHSHITRLPDSICMLYNLQTLLLQGCSKLTELPSNFSKLVNLHHLELPCDYYGNALIKKMPKHIGNLNNLQALSYFIVEERNESDLKELGKLNHLHGAIPIKGLGNVIYPADAATANLKDKKHLEELHLEFNGTREELDGSKVECNVSVFEALQPNSNLKRLTITYYNGSSFPNWLSGFHLSNLVSLNLKDCVLCSHLPMLGQFPSLKEISISNCNGIKIIGEEFYNNSTTNAPFRSLEVLKLKDMVNWEEWFCLEGFPLLKELTIRNCPKLKRALLPQHLPSLQKLHVFDCNELEELLCFEGFPLLKEIYIKKCPKLKKALLPQHLPSLQTLDVIDCNELEELLCLGEFPLLKGISISNCPELKRALPQHLPSLQILKISVCNKLEELLCLGEFPLLKEISISNCPELKRALPQHLPSLQKLNISYCNKMEASIPKCDNMIGLDIKEYDRILVNELPTSLKKLLLRQNRYTEFSVDQNLINFPFLEELGLDWSGFVKCPSLDLCCYNSLERLSIKGWHSSSLPLELHLFTKLQYLYLYDCPELESFPMGGLPSNLSVLGILNCPKLIGSREEWGLFQLNSLKSFCVSEHEFENVESFPEENLLPPTVDTLVLNNCSKLRIMNNKGFLHLKSLELLYITNCPSLESLPEKEDLPNSLNELWIKDCGIIKEKYEKEGGERWHTICHIRDVRIN